MKDGTRVGQGSSCTEGGREREREIGGVDTKQRRGDGRKEKMTEKSSIYTRYARYRKMRCMKMSYTAYMWILSRRKMTISTTR